MRITNESDYALRIVCTLATDGGIMNASAISESTSVTLRFALKILRKLSIAGIVSSKMGASGGYSLIRDPGELSIGELVEIIEGPIHVSNCTEPGYVCPRAVNEDAPCGYHPIFCEINEKLKNELYSISIADSISKTACPDN